MDAGSILPKDGAGGNLGWSMIEDRLRKRRLNMKESVRWRKSNRWSLKGNAINLTPT